jgi:hypothetical protein
MDNTKNTFLFGMAAGAISLYLLNNTKLSIDILKLKPINVPNTPQLPLPTEQNKTIDKNMLLIGGAGLAAYLLFKK